MNLNELIAKWQDKHSELLEDYELTGAKHIKNTLIQQLMRSEMKNVLEFIEDLKNLPNELQSVSNNELTQEVCSHYHQGICFYKKKCQYQTKDYECTNKLGGNDR